MKAMIRIDPPHHEHIRALKEGDSVEFDLGQDDRGHTKAVRVQVVSG